MLWPVDEDMREDAGGNDMDLNLVTLDENLARLRKNAGRYRMPGD